MIVLSFSWINIKDTDNSCKLGAVTLRDNASNIMMQIQFLSDYFHLRHNRQFEDTFHEGYIGIILYLSVQEQEKANSVFNDLRRVSLHASCAHRTQCAGAEFFCLHV